MDAVNEWAVAIFHVNAGVDATADLIFYFVHQCDVADATVAMKKYIGANATDGSEGLAYGIHNGTAWNLDSTAANKFYVSSCFIITAIH